MTSDVSEVLIGGTIARKIAVQVAKALSDELPNSLAVKVALCEITV
jgi:hypothetical protein